MISKSIQKTFDKTSRNSIKISWNRRNRRRTRSFLFIWMTWKCKFNKMSFKSREMNLLWIKFRQDLHISQNKNKRNLRRRRSLKILRLKILTRLEVSLPYARCHQGLPTVPKRKKKKYFIRICLKDNKRLAKKKCKTKIKNHSIRNSSKI